MSDTSIQEIIHSENVNARVGTATTVSVYTFKIIIIILT